MNQRNAVRRFLTLALTLAMVCGLGLTARAADTYELWVGGTEVTADNLSGDGWSYDAGMKTLTLTNFTYTGPGQWFDVGDGKEAAAILYQGEEPLTIQLVGENSVTHRDTCVASYGIIAEADLTIQGDGSLTAVAGEAKDCSYGITSNHRITVLSGTVNAAGSKSEKASAGFFATTGLSIEGGSVTAAGGESNLSRGLYVHGGDLTVKDGAVTASGGPGRESEGLFCFAGDLTVSGGTVTATGGPSSDTSYGIYDFGVLSITGGTVETTGGTMTATDETTNGVSMGIFDYEGGILISGGTLKTVGSTAIPTENGDRACSQGMQCDCAITVSGGQVTAQSGSGLDSTGIFTETDLTVSGGRVTVQSGSGTVTSRGLLALNDIILEGGTTDARSGQAGSESHAVFAGGDLLIRGANTAVTAAGGASGESSVGLLSQGDLTMEAGTVKAEGGSAPFCFGVTGDTVEIRDGTVTAAGGTAAEGEETYSFGIYSLRGMTLSGGTVTAQGKQAKYNCGLLNNEGLLAVSGGTVTAISEQYAVHSETMTVEGSDLVSFLTGDDAADAGASDLNTYLDSPTKYVFITYETTSSGGDVSDRFTDVKRDAWYHDAVQWAVDNGVMNGVSDDRFAPNDTCTRAMVVTMLWRMAGEPEANAPAPFTDVKDGAWYADAVTWAASTGAVTGMTADTFSPDTPVTREQLAAILYRYAQAQGKGFEGEWMFLLDYPDAAEVSDWADEAMHWMVMHGIINGMGDGTLVPQANATRAQIAAMFMRFAAEMEK